MQTSHPLNQRQILTLAAWGITLLVSAVPDILWHYFTGESPPWMMPVKIGLLSLALVISTFWQQLRPIRKYLLVMLAFFGLSALRPLVSFPIPILQNWFGSSVFDARMQPEQTGKLLVTLLMLALLLILGYRRRDFFLTLGQVRAPIRPVAILGFPKPDPWPWFGLQWAFYIALALGIMQYLGLRPRAELLTRVLPILPSILFYAALNAFNEEFFYRAPMIATLETISGSQQALWMSAFFFGIAHYFGTPGGLLGGIASIFMGWILGKGMLETRGAFWSWWIHFLSDVTIFTFLTLTLL
jgi:hypothetical protein